MKQYTTPDQTAKLTELGFEKPKNRLVKQRFDYSTSSLVVVGEEGEYSIGELIEVLPEYASQRLRYVATKRAWIFDVDILGKQGRCHRGAYYKELIDALYDMVVKLKEEGVI